MRVLLIQPPICDFYDTKCRCQPTGLAYLKASIKAELPDISAKIIDFHHGWSSRNVRLPSSLSYLSSFYAHPDESPFSTFHQFSRYGASEEEIERQIGIEKPDVVGISALFSAYQDEALEVARIAKRRGALTVVGGSAVSAGPVDFLGDPAIDFVVVGEGERPMIELLRTLNEKDPSVEKLREIRGLGFREGRTVQVKPSPPAPIDALPFPDLNDCPVNKYRYHRRALASIVTSRGCPHRCDFCSVQPVFGLHYRHRSVDSILAEMDARYAQGYRAINFEDDNLTFLKSHAMRLFDAIESRFPHGEIELLAMNGLSYFDLDSDLLMAMRRAGFSSLNLSLVSANDNVCRSLNRPCDLDRYLQIVEQAFTLGFQITSYQILGLPNETLDEAITTLRLNAQLPVLHGASVFYLPPGSCLERQWSGSRPAVAVTARSSALWYDRPDFTRSDVYTLFVVARMVNFLKSFSIADGSRVDWQAVFAKRDSFSGRKKLGLELIGELLKSGVLFASHGPQRYPCTQFNTGLFLRIWKTLSYVKTQSGGSMSLIEL